MSLELEQPLTSMDKVTEAELTNSVRTTRVDVAVFPTYSTGEGDFCAHILKLQGSEISFYFGY